ncbi:MAG: GAF domain-containing protein [Phototrophicaceae bacterium]
MADTQQPPQMPTDVHGQLRQLGRNVRELVDVIRTQQDSLRGRGVEIQSVSALGLNALKNKIDKLAQDFGGSQIELLQLRALADTTALITSKLDVDEVLNQVMDTVIRLTSAERGYIVLRNQDTGEMEFRVARGMAQEQLDNSEFIVSRTIVNRVVESGEPILTDNASNDARFQGHDSIIGFALRSILAVPLKSRNELMGVVYCDNRVLAGLFRQHELNLLTAFADQAGVAIDNARLFADARAQLNEVTSIRDLMENIFSSVASGIMTVSTDGRVTTLNATAEALLGAEKGQVLGRLLPDIFPDYSKALANSLRNVLTANRVERLEHTPQTHYGKRHWNIIISPLHDMKDDNAQGITLVIDDLTETKSRETQLMQVRRYVPMAGLDRIRAADLEHIQVEAREVTAIFCDVRGFTSFSEKLQPEDLMRVINRYLSLASDAVNLYEGIVDKYMGDAVTGLYNTQLNPQEDHAIRCVRAALSLVSDLYAQHEVLPEDQRLFYGIGIHTGQAVLGNVGGAGREEFTAIGEAMEISKVLQENAGPGEIIISQATFDQVQAMFECEPRTPAKTKGYDLPVVYRLMGRKKGAMTGPLMIDPELLALLAGDDL